MGRWTQYDEDSYRLPEGMRRVGYDADEGRYYFKDSAGKLWEGAEGAEFGELKQVGAAPVILNEAHEEQADLEAAGHRADGYQPLAVKAGASSQISARSINSQAYRTMFPFFLMILVVLLLVWRLAGPFQSMLPTPTYCTGDNRPYRVAKGDTCYDLSVEANFGLKQLKEANPGLDCNALPLGDILCLPMNSRKT